MRFINDLRELWNLSTVKQYILCACKYEIHYDNLFSLHLPIANSGILAKDEAVLVRLSVRDEYGLKLVQNGASRGVHQTQGAKIVGFLKIVALQRKILEDLDNRQTQLNEGNTRSSL